jgi:hypothetical protein
MGARIETEACSGNCGVGTFVCARVRQRAAFRAGYLLHSGFHGPSPSWSGQSADAVPVVLICRNVDPSRIVAVPLSVHTVHRPGE